MTAVSVCFDYNLLVCCLPGKSWTNGYGIGTVEDDIWKYVTNPGEILSFISIFLYLIWAASSDERFAFLVACHCALHCFVNTHFYVVAQLAKSIKLIDYFFGMQTQELLIRLVDYLLISSALYRNLCAIEQNIFQGIAE